MISESTLPASSLIICSRDRPQLLLETVESILHGEDVPTEMIIIDQTIEPHPELSKMTTNRSCEIRYIHARIVGVSASRNLGIRSSRYGVLILIDDDMLVEPDWFGNLMKAVIKAGPCSVVTGQVLAGKSEVPGGKAPSIKTDQHPAVYKGRIGKDVLYTGNMGAHRSVFDQVGVFDERLGPGTSFPAAEDNDFGYRLLEHGYSIGYAPEAMVYHRAWRSRDESLSLDWHYGVGRGAYYAKHMRWRDPYMFFRMYRDVKESLVNFLQHALYRRKLRYDYLYSAFGIFYGAIHWQVSQMGRS